MHVVVVGSGIIGVTSAYFLRKAGHEVTMVDRQGEVAMETSFANAGEVSPGYSSPWPAPGIPSKALSWAFKRHAPLIVRPRPDFALARWLFDFLRNCNDDSYVENKMRMLQLAEYSRDHLIRLRTGLGIDYDQRAMGTLQLFRNRKQMDATRLDRHVLDKAGVSYQLLSADGCADYEPALARIANSIQGGLRLPGDETGDCHHFATELADRVAKMGVRFVMNTQITGLDIDRDRISRLRAGDASLSADAYVFAAGSFTPRLLRTLGLRLPIYPVKGYSLTASIADAHNAPVSTVLDETYKVAITRLGNPIRVGGLAELSGFDLTLRERRRRTLELSAQSLFGQAADYRTASFWAGLRPMTPDGPPMIGRLGSANVFVNCGHGTLGWTMSSGSGALLADIVSERAPDLIAEHYAPSRSYH